MSGTARPDATPRLRRAKPPAPKPQHVALALLIGGAGGLLFAQAHLPLAWMIGAMTFTTVAAMSGLPVGVPRQLRSAMVMVLGVMLGSGFTPDILARVGEWSVSLAGLLLYVTAGTVAGLLFLARVARLDPVTAYFTATPGGLNEMVMVGHRMGGDDRTISLVHAMRIMAVVLVIPFTFQVLGYYDGNRRGPLGPSLLSIAPEDAALLLSCLIGYPIARLLRIPAAQLVGPMLLSAAIHLGGLTAGRPPALLVAVAQVVIGAALGCRFRGLRLATIARNAGLALCLTAILLGLTLLCALTLDRATGLGVVALALAFAPGGLAEMSLIALALHTDVALVATHHIVRIVLIVSLAPAVFVLWRRIDARRSATRAVQRPAEAADD